MGGGMATIEAPTIKELRQKVSKWTRGAEGAGLTDIRLGWDRSRVEETETGYKIKVWAHS